MAKNNKEIIVRVGANTAEFNKAMKSMNTHLGTMQKQISDFGKAVAGAVSIGGITAFASAALRASDEQVKANQKLLVALNGREDVQRRLLAQAELIRSTTGIDDAVVAEVQSFAAAQGRSESQIKKNTEAAVQLAAATGIDLLSAMKQVDATMEGNVGRLGKLDQRFKDLTETQLKNGDAVDLILSKYKGLAESQATDLELLTSNWGEFQEQAGNALGAVINPLLKETNKLLRELNSPDLTWMDKLNALRGLGGEAEFKMAVIQKKNNLIDNIQNSEAFKKAVAEKVAANRQITGYTEPTVNIKKPLKTSSTGTIKKQADEVKEFIPTFEEMGVIAANSMQSITLDTYNATDAILTYRDALDSSAESAKALTEHLTAMENAQMAGNAAADMFMQVVDQEITSAEELGKVIWNTSRKIIASYLAEGIAGAVKSALVGIPFPFNIIAAGVAGAGAGALFNTLVPKLADGGVVPGGYPNDTYPALLTSGETVVPAKRLPDFGAQKVEVYGVLRAGDIYLSNKRGAMLNGRIG